MVVLEYGVYVAVDIGRLTPRASPPCPTWQKMQICV
jgi:hypothetical protein